MGKSISEEKFLLLDKTTDFVISEEFEIANKFNNYYCNINNILQINYCEPLDQTYFFCLDPVEKCISKYTNHPSIIRIRELFTPNHFEFRKISANNIRNYILKLNKGKKTGGGIPTKILQSSIQSTLPLC